MKMKINCFHFYFFMCNKKIEIIFNNKNKCIHFIIIQFKLLPI